MDARKVNDDKLTPAKSFRNILLEKATQGKFSYSFNCDSPFRCMPSVSTPPSNVVIIKNPFEGQLTKRLHCTVFSPSVFNLKVASHSKTEEKFKWNIEEISHLKPADIDENTISQFESVESDSDMEQSVQSRIDTFFSGKDVVPSPFDAQAKAIALISENIDFFKPEASKQTVEGSAQTVLTLPPKLPAHIEEILKPYFSYTVDQQRDVNNRNTSLYRKLFEFDEQNSPDSVLTSPAPSCNLSPIEFSPCDEKQPQVANTRRNFGSPGNDNQVLDLINLSPIGPSSVEEPLAVATGSAIRLNFSERMSIDTSYNLVPDALDQMPINDRSTIFEAMHSPVPEAISDSSINWDLEYKHISFSSPENKMDVSNSNTPKSKIFISQRKKLSDSFLKIEEDDKEDTCEINMYVDKKSVRSAFPDDTGYHTGGLTMSEESWSSSHLFASTPTSKRYT